MAGTPEQIWQAAVPSYYDMATLNDTQVAELHRQFIARASAMSPSGRLHGGARIAVAITDLRSS